MLPLETTRRFNVYLRYIFDWLFIRRWYGIASSWPAVCEASGMDLEDIWTSSGEGKWEKRMYKDELKRIKVDGGKIDLGGCRKANESIWMIQKNILWFLPLSRSLVRSFQFLFLFSITSLWRLPQYRDFGNTNTMDSVGFSAACRCTDFWITQ